MPALLEAIADIAEVIEAHADEAEEARRLPPATVAALVDADLMRMCVPAAYGGPEVAPPTMIDAITAIAHADGAAGWCSMIASTTSSLSSLLPAEVAQQIYGDPSVVTGGVFAPNGKAERESVDGVDGLRVAGRWAWGSGTQHCAWILGGAIAPDAMRLCWFPADEVSFIDTWHTGGMRGSGSLDYSVDAAFVPLERTVVPGATPPVVDCGIARFPNFTLLACSVAAVGLGIGRRALDELGDIALGKCPQFSSRTLAQSGFTQIEFARAEAQLRSARAFLVDEVGSAWATVERGDDVTLDQRIAMRLAATHAATASASAADVAFTLAGGTSVYDTSVLGRCMRDAHVVTQHIQTAPKLNEKIGRLLLGHDDDVTMF
ncbi:MAG: acyl-CoA dehydrogenase family protein [Ilumatobacter sp.]|uniref:acyl-CoA dehydrogenase family protein n=1 Tax=Ilumatobacter sp. TaxID=1967498 RepID=UPI003C7747BA